MANVITEQQFIATQDKVEEGLKGIAKEVALGQTPIEAVEPDKRFGRDSKDAAIHAERFMEHCPTETAGIGFTKTELQADRTEGELKVAVGAMLIAKGEEIQREGQAHLNRMTDRTGKIYDLVESVRMSPIQSPANARVVTHGQPLLALKDGRSQQVRAARSKGKQTKETVAGLQVDNAVLSVEKKYYAGEPLKPGDVLLSKAPAESNTPPIVPPAQAARRRQSREA